MHRHSIVKRCLDSKQLAIKVSQSTSVVNSLIQITYTLLQAVTVLMSDKIFNISVKHSVAKQIMYGLMFQTTNDIALIL